MRKPLLIALTLAMVIASNVAYFLLKSEWSKQEEEMPFAINNKPAVEPPPLELLGHGAQLPSQEDLADEAFYDETQIAKASEWTNSPEAESRVAGVEQLSAFATPESEKILSSTLTLDFDPEVRRTAAQSLAAFKQPTENTVASLLAALEDDDENVQMSALNTLMPFANRFEYNSPSMKNFLASMNRIVSSRRTKELTRKAILSFLKDQTPPPAR